MSELDYPLVVLKIESGSFWIWLAGSATVMGWIKGILERAIDYGYRNFTTEGKITEGIPKKIESLKQIVQLNATLKANGQDTSITDDIVNKTLITVASELNNLIGTSNNISLDSNLYSLLPHASSSNHLPESTGGNHLLSSATDETSESSSEKTT